MCGAKLFQPHRFLNIPGGCVYDYRNTGHPRLLFDLYKTFFTREARHAQVEKDEIRYVIAVIPQISQRFYTIGGGKAGNRAIHLFCCFNKKLPVVFIIVNQ